MPYSELDTQYAKERREDLAKSIAAAYVTRQEYQVKDIGAFVEDYLKVYKIAQQTIYKADARKIWEKEQRTSNAWRNLEETPTKRNGR